MSAFPRIGEVFFSYPFLALHLAFYIFLDFIYWMFLFLYPYLTYELLLLLYWVRYFLVKSCNRFNIY